MYTKKQEQIAKEFVAKEKKKKPTKKLGNSATTTTKIQDLTLEQATEKYGEVGAELWAKFRYGWKEEKKSHKPNYFGGQGTF